MKNLNPLRLIIAGLVSGLILYLFESITNGVILAGPWKSWSLITSRAFAMPSMATSLTFWGLQALVAGLAAVFVQVLIKDWAGNRLRAAYVSALIVWVPGWLGLSFDKIALGLEPPLMIYANLLTALLGLLAGQYAAGYIYKDRPAAS
ncbi:MAG: hypothetical protein ACXU8U_04570 [Asticcacaulis sp.]